MEHDDLFLEGTSIFVKHPRFFCDVCVSSWGIYRHTFSQLIFLGGEEAVAGPLSDPKLLAKFWPSLSIFFPMSFCMVWEQIILSVTAAIRNSGFLDHAVCDTVVFFSRRHGLFLYISLWNV